MRIPMKIRSSYLWAGLVALAVVGWMVSDDLLSQRDDADKEMSSAAVGTGDALADEGDDSAKGSAQLCGFVTTGVALVNLSFCKFFAA